MFTPFSIIGCSLELLKPGEQGIVAFYQNENTKILDKIISIGIKIGTSITIEQQFPSLLVKVNNQTITINQKIARTIYVRIVES
ncbi:FeoA family protein [Anabaenopsis circularis NIES-21]|uniref:FeoA family protein n=1 Tax=Anabaenopsis circularis NIES-21 TaxID=1085406 RepID=A0A1Z4GCG6_9CYAN|nr:FeoA family protein [Anabaenopsis circularis NIES-21]